MFDAITLTARRWIVIQGFLPPAVRHGEGYVFTLSVCHGGGGGGGVPIPQCIAKPSQCGPIPPPPGNWYPAPSRPAPYPPPPPAPETLFFFLGGEIFFFEKGGGGHGRYASCGHAGGLSCYKNYCNNILVSAELLKCVY